MATINEDYVSFETAKLLKEKGFDEPCNAYWFHMINAKPIFNDNMPRQVYNNKSDTIEIIGCPTLQLAMKWLREVYGLHISLEPCYDYDSMHVVFLAFVQNVADLHEFMDGRKNVASYPNAEKSCELAIKYCLENLI